MCEAPVLRTRSAWLLHTLPRFRTWYVSHCRDQKWLFPQLGAPNWEQRSDRLTDRAHPVWYPRCISSSSVSLGAEVSRSPSHISCPSSDFCQISERNTGRLGHWQSGWHSFHSSWSKLPAGPDGSTVFGPQATV